MNGTGELGDSLPLTLNTGPTKERWRAWLESLLAVQNIAFLHARSPDGEDRLLHVRIALSAEMKYAQRQMEYAPDALPPLEDN